MYLTLGMLNEDLPYTAKGFVIVTLQEQPPAAAAYMQKAMEPDTN